MDLASSGAVKQDQPTSLVMTM